MSKADELRAWALERVGCGYVWGSRGELCTEALLARLQTQYPKQTNISTTCRKWLGKRVYDCATLVRYGLESVGIAICSGASSQWRGDYWAEKGPIEQLPEGMVCVLYNESANANPMGHTGIYLGDGYAVDARSSSLGVVRSALGSRKWSHYAVPKGLYDTQKEGESARQVGQGPDQAGAVQAGEKTSADSRRLDVQEDVVGLQAIVKAETGKTVRMRELPNSKAAVLLDVGIGSTVTVEEQADGWARIVCGGVRGYMMAQFLALENEKADKEDADGSLEQRLAAVEAWIAAHDNGGVQG